MAEYKALVLAVDDEEHIAEVVRQHLELRGYRVLTENSGQGALEVLEKETPEVMVLDIMMPGMSGIDVLKVVS